MLIHTAAGIPLKQESLGEALRKFTDYVRDSLLPGSDAEASITLNETGARATAMLASSLPAETEGFGLGFIPSGKPLTAAQFRESVSLEKPKRTRAQVRLHGPTLVNLFPLLDRLAGLLPASGRGMMLLVHLTHWTMAGSTIAAVVDVRFSRFRHGTKATSGVIALRFSALSLKDPIVTRTIATASASLKLHFSKPLAAFQGDQSLEQAEPSRASDPRLKPPTSEEQLIVLVSFDEALARAAEQIHARTEDLSQIPLLVSQSKSFHKRFDDVMSGKRESLNLPSQLKQFMRRRFPDYSFEAADSEQVWFRKSLAPTLDHLLMFDRIYHHGLGKTFTLELGVDFPNTRFGGMYTGWGGTRKNLFWMFHQGWEKQVWAYTTARELTAVLEACGRLLERVLPAIEQQCQQLLLPPPAAFPSGISQHGPLSARQAYEVARSGADKWTSDAELGAVSSSSQLALRRQVGQATPSITENGRLTPHGGWGFKFLSKRLDSYCYYQVPHTGRVWWNFYSFPQGGIPKYSAVLEFDDWLDSSVIAPQAFVALRERYSSFAAYTSSLVLHDPNRYSGNFIWELTCDGEDGSGSKRKTITVQLDCRSGRVLGTSVR